MGRKTCTYVVSYNTDKTKYGVTHNHNGAGIAMYDAIYDHPRRGMGGGGRVQTKRTKSDMGEVEGVKMAKNGRTSFMNGP